MGTFLFEFTAKGPIFMNSCLDMLKGQLMESDFQRDPCCTKKKLPVNCAGWILKMFTVDSFFIRFPKSDH